MIQTLKLSNRYELVKFFVATVFTVLALVSAFSATPISADAKEDACEGIEIATGQPCNSSDQAEDTIGGIVERVVQILSIVVGVIAAIMIIVGGFRYIVSGGDANAAASARKTIVYAAIGLAVVILSQVIINLVVSTADSAADGASGGGT